MITALILIAVFGVLPVALGKLLKWANTPSPRRLHRRPNIRIVKREKDHAA